MIESQDRYYGFITKSVTPAEPELKESAMSLAEQLKHEGREEGYQKGRLEVAKHMLEVGAEDGFILKATQISSEELAMLKKELGKK